MCIGASASHVPKVKPPPEPMKGVDEAMQKARQDQARKAMLMAGLAGTVATSPLGLPATSSTVAVKTLLGG